MLEAMPTVVSVLREWQLGETLEPTRGVAAPWIALNQIVEGAIKTWENAAKQFKVANCDINSRDYLLLKELHTRVWAICKMVSGTFALTVADKGL